MYPAANTASTTAIARNAAGMPVSPVCAYADGISPAATVSGATAAKMNASTAGTPTRSRASARDTALGLGGAVCADMIRTPNELAGYRERVGGLRLVRCERTALETVIRVWVISVRRSGTRHAVTSSGLR